MIEFLEHKKDICNMALWKGKRERGMRQANASKP